MQSVSKGAAKAGKGGPRKRIKKKIRFGFKTLKSKLQGHRAKCVSGGAAQRSAKARRQFDVMDLNDKEFDRDPRRVLKLPRPKTALTDKMKAPAKAKAKAPPRGVEKDRRPQAIKEVSQKDLLSLSGHELTRLKQFVFERDFKGLPSDFHRQRKLRYGW